MKITIKLIGPFIYDTGYSEKELEVPAGTTVDAFLALLPLSKQRPMIVTRNGKAVAAQEVLEEGDKIAVSPIYSGG
jgi:sulfur carrier protein ThiS